MVVTAAAAAMRCDACKGNDGRDLVTLRGWNDKNVGEDNVSKD